MEHYLIAHKVRGEPAFDIAVQMEVDGEILWITSTYGHRAYPYAYWKVEELFDGSDYPHARPEDALEKMPEDCPEHFEVSGAPKGTGLKDGRSILQRLGLLKPAEPMTRRDW